MVCRVRKQNEDVLHRIIRCFVLASAAGGAREETRTLHLLGKTGKTLQAREGRRFARKIRQRN
jgi:hypothetical protein